MDRAETRRMSLMVGAVLKERYQILRVIKAGGMGAVFEAQDLNLEGTCAVKEMREELARGSDPDWAIRHFQQEAHLLAELNHPGVPKVRDFFMDGTTCFVVMDFVAGDNLEEELEQGPSPPEQVKADAVQVLEILEYLHGLQPPVIHRDLKPSNLIRQKESGRIMLVDFGLARPSSSTLSTHTSAGTVAYCPPEQLRGKAEPRSDLYSLGATMYHLLTGEQPAFGDIPNLSSKLPPCDRNLALVIAKATLAQPADRFATARAMREALLLERPLPEPTVASPPNRTTWALASLVLFALLGAAWLGHSASPQARPPATPVAGDSAPELVEVQPQATLCCREDVSLDKLGTRYGAMLTEVHKFAEARGLHLSGPNYSRYLVWDPPRRINVEVGSVVPQAAADATGPVFAGQLPGGWAVHCTHRGSYDTLSTTYVQLQVWMGQQHLKPVGPAWACYGEGGSLPVTEVYWPVERPASKASR